MESSRTVAITGTPGCGKTSLCSHLEGRGHAVATVVALAKEYGCLGEQDPNDGAAPVDVHKLAEEWEHETEGLLFVDGHLAHLLEVDAVVVLRCHPEQLGQRLTERGYDEQKVRSNVEWEMIAGTWSELIEFELDVPLLELDAGETSSEQLATDVLAWIADDCPSDGVEASAREAIDWLA